MTFEDADDAKVTPRSPPRALPQVRRGRLRVEPVRRGERTSCTSICWTRTFQECAIDVDSLMVQAYNQYLIDLRERSHSEGAGACFVHSSSLRILLLRMVDTVLPPPPPPAVWGMVPLEGLFELITCDG